MTEEQQQTVNPQPAAQHTANIAPNIPNSQVVNSQVIQPVAPEPTSKAIAVFGSEVSFKAAQKMARAITASSLMPLAFRGEENIPNALIAMELANRLGASVFQIAQNLNVIDGRPSFGASFLIATVNSSGRFTPMRFRWEGTSGTDSWGCRAVAKDKETGEECLGSLVSIGLAKAEGWYGRKHSKWPNMPDQMCMYRAAALWQRIYMPEASIGMRTTEEDDDFLRAVPVTATSSTTLSDLEAKLREPSKTFVETPNGKTVEVSS